MSAFSVAGNGTLTSIGSSPFADNQTAPCWVEISHDGQYLFTVNTASNSISSYTINPDGSLTLIGSTAFKTPGLGAFDARLSPDGTTLWVVGDAGNSDQRLHRQRRQPHRTHHVADRTPCGRSTLRHRRHLDPHPRTPTNQECEPGTGPGSARTPRSARQIVSRSAPFGSGSSARTRDRFVQPSQPWVVRSATIRVLHNSEPGPCSLQLRSKRRSCWIPIPRILCVRRLECCLERWDEAAVSLEESRSRVAVLGSEPLEPARARGVASALPAPCASAGISVTGYRSACWDREFGESAG